MPYDQIAALPLRRNNRGKLRVLLVTSRQSRRWVLPKGWQMEGKEPWEAAGIEAFEEAGVEGKIGKKRIGTYRYAKRLKDDEIRELEVEIFPLWVEKQRKRWPERRERRRKWYSRKAAFRVIEDPGLRRALREIFKSDVLKGKG